MLVCMYVYVSVFRPHALHPVTARLPVPKEIIRPPYALDPPVQPRFPGMILPPEVSIKKDEELPAFRRACNLASRTRAYAGSLVQPEITPDEIDRLTHEYVIKEGGYPSPLGFLGNAGPFPKSICSSINQVVVHGIPDTRPLENGDIVNFDVSTYIGGYHGDCSATFLVGEVDEAGQLLVERTRESLLKAIEICAPGVPFSKIGDTICDYLDPYNYGVVTTFTGHGIGTEFHTSPAIFHNRNNGPGSMMKNMTFTIEPAINEGKSPDCVMLEDGWTYVTTDGTRSAQFEDVILITDTGAEILTTHLPEEVDF